MADFNVLDSEALNHGGVTSQDTTLAITPAVGDVACVTGGVSAGTGAALSGGGMTWELEVLVHDVDSDSFLAVFRAASGTPSEGVLTFTSSDNWIDTTYAVVRPVDLEYTGVAGSDSSEATVDTMSITLSTSSPAGLLGFCHAALANQNMAEDTANGFAEIGSEIVVAQGRTLQLQEKFGDAAALVIDSQDNTYLLGAVLEFSAEVEEDTFVAQVITG